MYIFLHDEEIAALLRLISKTVSTGPKADNGHLSNAKERIETEISRRNDPLYASYIAAAQEKHLSDEGEIEVDDNALVSESEQGAYVMAWTWVGKSDIEGGEDDGDE